MSNTSNNTNTTPSTKVEEYNLSEMNTSQSIRFLSTKGLTTSQIYNYLKGRKTTKTGGEIRYQHVRNVLLTPLTSSK